MESNRQLKCLVAHYPLEAKALNPLSWPLNGPTLQSAAGALYSSQNWAKLFVSGSPNAAKRGRSHAASGFALRRGLGSGGFTQNWT